MPWNRRDYPPDWKAIGTRIRARAGQRCEWPGCGAPNGTLIWRCDFDREHWHRDGGWAGQCSCDGRPVVVVLTVAHTCQDASCADESHLRAWCQWHHLRFDARQHADSAARTRRRRLIERGQRELFA